MVDELLATLPDAFGRSSPLAQDQYLELRTLLPGYILASQGDRMLMAHGVEGRFPFLSPAVAELACALPDRFKLCGLREKHVLKRAAQGLVPEVIRARPKQPYRAPDARCFTGPAAPEWVHALLAPGALREAGLFEPDAVRALVAKCEAAAQPLSNTDDLALVGVISTQLLFERFVRRPQVAPEADAPLARRGVTRGDRVFVFGDNTPESVIGFWAALKADAVVCMVSPQTRPEKLAYMLNDARASALLTEANHLATAAAATAQSPHLRSVLAAAADAAALSTLPGAADLAAAAAEEDGAHRRRDGQRLPPGKVGQIVVRGGTVMRGYWEKPEATARRLRPGPLPGEQVLLTGDYGRLDEDGFLYFVGRMDDIIKCRGEKVAPREVENALMNVEGVREAAVVGVPDEVLGQAIKAFVTLEAGATLGAEALRRHCQMRLEPFMVPTRIEIVEALPKTSSGKIKKTDLA